ncbi:MAG: MotA/TolQ/ExbB proton channel family protein [Bdellovibrionales bacterium]|nr:MotA/TolQ/ExbB proton channel family protein [Bdellovibrionales bacterium]
METISKISLAFTQGGMWMWVILGLQIVSTAIILERLFYLYRRRSMGEMEFVNQFEQMVRKGDLDAALAEAQKHESRHPLARVAEAGIKSALNLGGRDEIQGKMDEVLLDENGKLERRTPFLAMLANVGTLTGLLGTIVGMIKSFSAVSEATPVEKAALLSSGISEAMNTTAYGLIMAIPALIMFAVLTNRSHRLADDLNQSALRLFNWLSFAYEPVTARPVRADQRPL